MTCNNCGADNPPTYKFCQNCGSGLELGAAPINPPTVRTISQPPRSSNTRLFAAGGAIAIVCVCVCGALLAWMYIANDPNLVAARSSALASPTRRVTNPPDASQDRSTPISPSSATLTPAANAPGATPAAVFSKWKVAQVEGAFQAARLEFVNPRAMTNDDYGSVPRVAKEGVRFFLPSLGGQKGGRIYSFASLSDLKTVEQYYNSQGGTKPWIFIKDNILVQIHSDLAENRATQYQNALNALK